MPYFVFRVFPARQLELADTFEQYRDARVAARTMRASLTEMDKHTIKMTFAPTFEAAERQLREVREARPAGEDE
jgi:hypothetical protein